MCMRLCVCVCVCVCVYVCASAVGEPPPPHLLASSERLAHRRHDVGLLAAELRDVELGGSGLLGEHALEEEEARRRMMRAMRLVNRRKEDRHTPTQ